MVDQDKIVADINGMVEVLHEFQLHCTEIMAHLSDLADTLAPGGVDNGGTIALGGIETVSVHENSGE